MLDHHDTPSEPPEGLARGLSRGLIVGGYEGLRAGEAIVAVRGLGLRPSPERVEGYEDSLHGFVVSQEPSSGTEVSADTQVFLYVAAPARTAVAPEILAETDAEEAEPEEGSEDHGSVEATSPNEGEEPPFEELETQEFAGLDPDDGQELVEEPEASVERPDAGDDESAEPVRVWHGPPPGAVPRRRLTSPLRGARRSFLRLLPSGLHLAVFGLLACVALAVLLAVTSQLHGSPRSHSPVASQPPRRAEVPHVPSPIRAPVVAAPAVVRPSRQTPASHRARPTQHATAIAPRRAPLPVSRPSSVAPLTGAAAEEHAIREFGP